LYLSPDTEHAQKIAEMIAGAGAGGGAVTGARRDAATPSYF